jgi:hypothetical protein
MNICRLAPLALATALVVGGSFPASVQAGTINFDGTLTNLVDPNNLSGIDPTKLAESLFSGSYTFDPATPDSLGGRLGSRSANYLLRPNVEGQGIAAKIGNLSLAAPIGESSYFSRQFNNNDVRGWDYVEIDNGTSVGGSNQTRLFLSLEDQSGQALSSVGPNADPTSLTGWSRGAFQVIAPNFTAEGKLTNLALAAPEPGPIKVVEPSLWVGLLGFLLGLVMLRKRQSVV